jgi:hypothetical protein
MMGAGMGSYNSEIAEAVSSWWYVTWSMSGGLGIRPVNELHALNVINARRGGHPVACTVLGIFPTSESAQGYRAEIKRMMKEQRHEGAGDGLENDATGTTDRAGVYSDL